MFSRKYFVQKFLEVSGIMLAVFLVFAAVVFAFTTWAPGSAPAADPGAGNVELSSLSGVLTNYEIVSKNCSNLNGSCSVNCPTGKVVIGGGCSCGVEIPNRTDRPDGNNSWYCKNGYYNWAGSPYKGCTSMTAYAICVSIN